MGGNLLPSWGLPKKRLGKAEFLGILEKVRLVFASQQCEVFPLNFFSDKEDFGDLDIVIPDGIIKNIDQFIEKEFGYKPHKNCTVYSFPVEGFQVDANVLNREDIETTLFYFTSDAGNLEGRIFHKMGLKHSHEGLKYVIRDELFGGSGSAEEVLLTKDIKQICEIGGFDYEVRMKGFKNEKDLYYYIYNSKYFKSSLFKFNSLNHRNRTRNRKRPVFCRFVEFIDSLPKKDFQFKDKQEYLKELCDKFPILKERLEARRKLFLEKRDLSEKFNGDIIRRVKGLSGEDLGKFISLFKKMYPVESLEKMSSEEIREKIINFSIDFC